MPSGRPPVSATTACSPPSGEMRTIRPSTRPAQSWPSASTTTSSGPSPGTGTTVTLASGRSGNGSTGGGVQRIGLIGGLRSFDGTPTTLAPDLQQPARFAQHAVQDLVDGVELLLTADQRRRQLHDWVAAVVGAAVQACLEDRRRQKAAQQPLRFLVVERLLGGLVLDEFDAVEEAFAADVADDRQVVELLQGGAERGRAFLDVVVDALALEDVEVGQRHRRRDGMTAERVAVPERGLTVVERLEQPITGDHRADRRVAGRQTLCAGDDVGDIAEIVTGEHRADAAVGADHLVGHQQYVVLVADFANALEIPWRRREAAP